MSQDVVVPSRSEPVARGASTLIGGPLGRRARIGGARFWTPLMVLLMWTFVTFALGFAVKAPCRNPGRWTHEFQYTRMCYSDVEALYFAEGLDTHQTPYVDHKVEYPVVIGGAMFAADRISTLFAEPRPVQVVDDKGVSRTVLRKPSNATGFFDVTAFFLVLAALAVTATTVVAAGRRRQWDAAMVALAPGLLLHGTTNWDLLAAAAAGLAIAAWARRRPWLAGLFIGVGVATKLYPLLFLWPLFFLCLRARKVVDWAVAAATAVLSWLALNVYFILATPAAWAEFFVLNRKRGADWDSIYLTVQYVKDHAKAGSFLNRFLPDFNDVARLNAFVVVLVGLAMVAVAVLIWRAPRRPRVAQVLFLTLAAFLLLNKVNSPQYVIWLVPLAVLARPRWGAFLVWQALEVAVYFTRFYFFVCNDKGGDATCSQGLHQPWFLTSVMLRDVALAVVMALVVREIRHPHLDVVRRDGDDDPAGGVLDGARDRGDVDERWFADYGGVPATR